MQFVFRSENLAIAAGAAVGQKWGQPATFIVHALATDFFWKRLYPLASSRVFQLMGTGLEVRAGCLAAGVVAGFALPHLVTRGLAEKTPWSWWVLGRIRQEHEKDPGVGSYLAMWAVSGTLSAFCRMKGL